MKPHLLLSVALTATAGHAQINVNGSIIGNNYCNSTFQTLQTGFGDNVGELDAGYGRVVNDRLYLAVTGNIEANFNKLEIFVDSVPGGENVLSGLPGNDGSSNMAGLTFDAGFEADYHLIVRRGDFGGPVFDLDFGVLGTTGFDSYLDVFGGANTGIGVVGPGSTHLSTIEVAYNDSNAAGVSGGCDSASLAGAFGVQTGLELSIALSDLGTPANLIKICVFQNNSDHNYASNQFLGGLRSPQCNLGGDGNGGFTGTLAGIDLNLFTGDQFFTVAPCPTTTPLPRPLFGVDLRGDRFFTTDVTAFGANLRALSSFAENPKALDFSANGLTLWAIDGVTYGQIDILSGAFTPVGLLTGPLGATGLTAAPNGVDWYLAEPTSTGTALWVGDIATGVFTQLGPILPAVISDISMNAVNELFGVDITSDRLVSIDLTTGAGTIVGPMGLPTSVGQSIDFDWAAGVLYTAVDLGAGAGEFAIIDPATGAATIVESTTPLDAELRIAVRVPGYLTNQSVCNGFPNSTGLPGRLQIVGSSLRSANLFLLTVHNLPQNSTGYFLNSPDLPFTVVSPGGSQGAICIASLSNGRHSAFPLQSGLPGAVRLQLDLSQIPQPTSVVSIMGGTTWSWQYWYRDSLPGGGASSNFSNARSVQFF